MMLIRVCPLKMSQEPLLQVLWKVRLPMKILQLAGQRHLFTQPSSRQSDDVEDVGNKHNKNLRRIYNQSQELDMELVHEEAKEEGKGG
jgi:hypothetical protein